MSSLFDPESVRVIRTDLSRPEFGIHHLFVKVGGVTTAFHARLVQIYLAHRLKTTVLGVYDGNTQEAVFSLRVITPIGIDAVTRVQGHLGLQGLKYAPLVRKIP